MLSPRDAAASRLLPRRRLRSPISICCRRRRSEECPHHAVVLRLAAAERVQKNFRALFSPRQPPATRVHRHRPLFFFFFFLPRPAALLFQQPYPPAFRYTPRPRRTATALHARRRPHRLACRLNTFTTSRHATMSCRPQIFTPHDARLRFYSLPSDTAELS